MTDVSLSIKSASVKLHTYTVSRWRFGAPALLAKHSPSPLRTSAVLLLLCALPSEVRAASACPVDGSWVGGVLLLLILGTVGMGLLLKGVTDEVEELNKELQRRANTPPGVRIITPGEELQEWASLGTREGDAYVK